MAKNQTSFWDTPRGKLLSEGLSGIVGALVGAVVAGVTIVFLFQGRISSLESTISVVDPALSEIRSDLRELRSDIKGLANLNVELAIVKEKVQSLASDVQSVRDSVKQIQVQAGSVTFRAWLIATKPTLRKGDDAGWRTTVHLIDAKSGRVKTWKDIKLDSRDDQRAMFKLWGIAGASDGRAEPLSSYLFVDETDDDEPANRIWLGCSFGLVVTPDAVPQQLLVSELGPVKTLTTKPTPPPTNVDNLTKFLRSNPTLLDTN